jgi:hypothetical protein
MKFALCFLTLYMAAAAQAGVVLSSLTATPVNRQVKIAWTVSVADEPVRFEIHRNGIFAARTQIAAASSDPQSYEWTDREVQNDFEYVYALVAITADGSSETLGSVLSTPAFDNYAVKNYSLNQNYPNPFNPTTTISIDLAESGYTLLRVFDVLGREVNRPIDQMMPRGRHAVLFDGRNLPSGVYLYQLDVNGFSAQKKMILMK